MKLIHDDHIHLRGHGDTWQPHRLAPILEEAARRGIAPGVREHGPLPGKYHVRPYSDQFVIMMPDEIDPFLDQFAEAGIAFGLEMDFISGDPDGPAEAVAEIVQRAAARGVALSGAHGSIHFLPGNTMQLDFPRGIGPHTAWDLDESMFVAHIKNRGPKQLLHDYFGCLRDLVETGHYDCVAHFELIRKFDKRNASGESIFYSDHERLYDRLARGVLERVSQTRMAVELNTSGIDKSLGRPYLSQELLNYAVELGVPVCLGSDAHAPACVAGHFDTALHMLEAAGCERPVTFVNRKPVPWDAV